MIEAGFHINLWELVAPIAKAADMMSPVVGEHHMRVAYLSMRLCEELDIPYSEQMQIVTAAVLHDIGAFSLQERIRLLDFEETLTSEHALAGYLLLKDFHPFKEIASLVRNHHLPWDDGEARMDGDIPVHRGSHIIHLADRVAVLLSKDRPVLSQVEGICEKVAKKAGAVFVPSFVEGLEALAHRDFIWLEAVSPSAEAILRRHVAPQFHELDLEELVRFSHLICRIVDFKSEFTAMHSSGVAATAVEMGRLIGFSQQECQMLEIAGYLHDLGKLTIPSEVLEKPNRLTPDEWHVMRTHVFYTYQILEPIPVMDTITQWGALHQERLDGSGYPFCRKGTDLPLGARIMAVADVFTAVSEDRPYRTGMNREKALRTLQDMAERRELDQEVVALLAGNYASLNETRLEAQEEARKEYASFRSLLTAHGCL